MATARPRADVLDVGTFEVALDNALKDVVAGYVARLRQSGQIVFNNAWQYAKRPPDVQT